MVTEESTETQATESEKPEISDQKPNDLILELARLFVDLITKIAYPLLILFILVFLSPRMDEVYRSEHLRNVLKEFSNRISNAKLGQFEIQLYEQAQEAVAEKAEENSPIVQLEKRLTVLEEKFTTYVIASGNGNLLESGSITKVQKKYDRNEKYTVLVFNRSHGFEIAEKIKNSLLKEGFKSARIETDFSEIENPHPKGTIYLSYKSGVDGEIKESVEKIMTDVIENTDVFGSEPFKFVPAKSGSPLSRGNFQILVF